MDKSVKFIRLNIYYVLYVPLWIKYWLMLFESLLVLIRFKFKKRPNIFKFRVVKLTWRMTYGLRRTDRPLLISDISRSSTSSLLIVLRSLATHIDREKLIKKSLKVREISKSLFVSCVWGRVRVCQHRYDLDNISLISAVRQSRSFSVRLHIMLFYFIYAGVSWDISGPMLMFILIKYRLLLSHGLKMWQKN